MGAKAAILNLANEYARICANRDADDCVSLGIAFKGEPDPDTVHHQTIGVLMALYSGDVPHLHLARMDHPLAYSFTERAFADAYRQHAAAM